MHTTEATYAIKQEGRGTEALFYYGLQDYSPSRTRASAPRPPAPIIVIIIILYWEVITLLKEDIYWVLEDVARRPPSYYSLQGLSQVGQGSPRPVLQHPSLLSSLFFIRRT